MQQLRDTGLRSVTLTSGTPSPIKPFISELGIHIDVQLENPHIVESNQVCIGVFSRGPDEHFLNSSFNSRYEYSFLTLTSISMINF